MSIAPLRVLVDDFRGFSQSFRSSTFLANPLKLTIHVNLINNLNRPNLSNSRSADI
jgi:hypothetical protein